MKIAIVNITGGGLSGGYRKYLQRIVPLLERCSNVSEISVYLPPQAMGSFGLISNNFVYWPDGDDKNSFEWLRKSVTKFVPDVVFFPTGRYINFDNIPTVAMVRNMEPLSTPFGGNPIGEAIKNIGRAYSAKKACHRATRIIAVSKHVKSFLIKKWNMSPDKISLVYHGIDFPDNLNLSAVPDRLIGQYSDSFLFTAGSIRPARGLEDIVHAYGLIYKKVPDIKLVIGGAIDPWMQTYKENELDTLISKYGMISSVIWTGPLSSSEMSWCYSNCKVFIMTSRAEACPNIVLEAMAHGCISISTDNPPLPEFFKDTAVYYPPRNNHTLSNKILEVLSWKDSKRLDMAERTKKRALRFSWDICAEKTVEQFRLAMEEFKRKAKR